MGSILDMIFGDLDGTEPEDWTDVVTAGPFDERTIVSHALFRSQGFGPGACFDGFPHYLKDGTLLYVPENTAAYIFAQGGIEQVLTSPGGYVYDEGLASPYEDNSSAHRRRAQLAGNGPFERRVAFVNLREIRNIAFSTEGPVVYNDTYYDADLEIEASGTFSVRVTDTERLVREFVPAGVLRYSFDFPRAREQVVDEFLQSLVVALDDLSGTHRISQLPAHAHRIAEAVRADRHNVGSWPVRFGFALSKVAIERITFGPDSRELIRRFNAQRLEQRAREHPEHLDLEGQAQALRTWKALLDDGIITPEEFEAKKRHILEL